MSHVVWTQWDDIKVPAGFTALNPATRSLDDESLADITFYVPQYMSGRKALTYATKMDALQHFQLPNAGFEDALEFKAEGVTLYNARGVHDDSTAELAVGLAITARRGFADFMRAQQKHEWAHKRYSSLNDSTILIVGAGSIASTIERYFSVYSVKVKKFSRSGSNGSLKISDLDSHLRSADVVILALPLNNESAHLFNSERIGLMKHGATLVNVARGGIVDTEALIEALKAGKITAGLDVTDPEPLPADHALWEAKGCIIAPHVGGDSTAFDSRCKRLVEEQLARLARGEALINVVG